MKLIRKNIKKSSFFLLVLFLFHSLNMQAMNPALAASEAPRLLGAVGSFALAGIVALKKITSNKNSFNLDHTEEVSEIENQCNPHNEPQPPSICPPYQPEEPKEMRPSSDIEINPVLDPNLKPIKEMPWDKPDPLTGSCIPGVEINSDQEGCNYSRGATYSGLSLAEDVVMPQPPTSPQDDSDPQSNIGCSADNLIIIRSPEDELELTPSALISEEQVILEEVSSTNLPSQITEVLEVVPSFTPSETQSTQQGAFCNVVDNPFNIKNQDDGIFLTQEEIENLNKLIDFRTPDGEKITVNNLHLGGTFEKGVLTGAHVNINDRLVEINICELQKEVGNNIYIGKIKLPGFELQKVKSKTSTLYPPHFTVQDIIKTENQAWEHVKKNWESLVAPKVKNGEKVIKQLRGIAENGVVVEFYNYNIKNKSIDSRYPSLIQDPDDLILNDIHKSSSGALDRSKERPGNLPVRVERAENALSSSSLKDISKQEKNIHLCALEDTNSISSNVHGICQNKVVVTDFKSNQQPNISKMPKRNLAKQMILEDLVRLKAKERLDAQLHNEPSPFYFKIKLHENRYRLADSIMKKRKYEEQQVVNRFYSDKNYRDAYTNRARKAIETLLETNTVGATNSETLTLRAQARLQMNQLHLEGGLGQVIDHTVYNLNQKYFDRSGSFKDINTTNEEASRELARLCKYATNSRDSYINMLVYGKQKGVEGFDKILEEELKNTSTYTNRETRWSSLKRQLVPPVYRALTEVKRKNVLENKDNKKLLDFVSKCSSDLYDARKLYHESVNGEIRNKEALNAFKIIYHKSYSKVFNEMGIPHGCENDPVLQVVSQEEFYNILESKEDYNNFIALLFKRKKEQSILAKRFEVNENSSPFIDRMLYKILDVQDDPYRVLDATNQFAKDSVFEDHRIANAVFFDKRGLLKSYCRNNNFDKFTWDQDLCLKDLVLLRDAANRLSFLEADSYNDKYIDRGYAYLNYICNQKNLEDDDDRVSNLKNKVYLKFSRAIHDALEADSLDTPVLNYDFSLVENENFFQNQVGLQEKILSSMDQYLEALYRLPEQKNVDKEVAEGFLFSLFEKSYNIIEEVGQGNVEQAESKVDMISWILNSHNLNVSENEEYWLSSQLQTDNIMNMQELIGMSEDEEIQEFVSECNQQ